MPKRKRSSDANVALKSGSRLEDVSIDLDGPHCQHGPTVLFKQQGGKQFYACAAYRDRKACSFYVDLSSARRAKPNPPKSNKSPVTHPIRHSNWTQLSKKSIIQRIFCLSCCSSVSDEAKCTQSGHNLIRNISDEHLNQPVRGILSRSAPKTKSKREAQYYFSDESSNLIVSMLCSMPSLAGVICIGTPTIHELLNERMGTQVPRSFLLDIDELFETFYPHTQFARYNMFNGHFFRGDTAKNELQKFISTAMENDPKRDEVLILIDPPFGGLLRLLLGSTQELINSLSSDNKVKTKVMLASPYFLERKMTTDSDKLPLKFLPPHDMAITYDNHKQFHKSADKSQGDHATHSPVRLFTDFPITSGMFQKTASTISNFKSHFRLCTHCPGGGRIVARSQVHCKICGRCQSREGNKPAKHCAACKRCVKAEWSHCAKCDKCHTPQHQCGQK